MSLRDYPGASAEVLAGTADARHGAGELVARFPRGRRAFGVIGFSEDPGVPTAGSNDCRFQTVFARQVEASGDAGGGLPGWSTSGTSRKVAGQFEPARHAPPIQRVPLRLYHHLCEYVERRTVDV
ncbi:MAG TPA: hypothetical protein VMB03_27710 [Bryobacteraceae bacterium]|nr:hypothetical protein [Bryobacteraceae bacterium]